MSIPELQGEGLFFMADPHVAATPPGQRLEGYAEQILDKLRAGLDFARENALIPVILGDLFHWPRENPNSLLVALIGLFGGYPPPFKPWVLVGNHDKYQARFTPDVSLAVLQAADAVHVMSEAGPQFFLQTNSIRALMGASPDFAPIPAEFSPPEDAPAPEIVLWGTHHSLGFPEYMDKQVKPVEIPGVDWIVNGHLHRPQPTLERGRTRWANPGSMTRMRFTRLNIERRPAGVYWTPECQESGELHRWEAPFLPFAEVFPSQELPTEDRQEIKDRESLFLQGLERLSWRKTREGLGLKQFLQSNVVPDAPESELIWELYEEVVKGEST